MARSVYVPQAGGFIDFKDTATDAEITSYLSAKYPSPAPAPTPALTPTSDGDVGPWESSGLGWLSRFQTAGGGIAEMLGAEDASKYMYDKAQANLEEAARYQPPSDQGALGWLSDTAIQAAPDLAGGLAATLGGAQAGAGIGAIAGAGTPAEIATIPVGATIGGIVGALSYGFGSALGSNIQEQAQESNTSLAEANERTAAIAAVPQAALDALADRILVGRLIPGTVPKAIVRKVVGEGVIKHIVKGGISEGLTEGAQQAIQIGQANPERLFDFGPDVQSELAQAAIAGGILGGAVGGASVPAEHAINYYTSRGQRQLQSDLASERATNTMIRRQGDVSLAADDLLKAGVKGSVTIQPENIDGLDRYTIKMPSGDSVGEFLSPEEAAQAVDIYKQRSGANVTVRTPEEAPSVFPVRIGSGKFNSMDDVVKARDTLVAKRDSVVEHITNPDLLKRTAAEQKVSEDFFKAKATKDIDGINKAIKKYDDFLNTASPVKSTPAISPAPKSVPVELAPMAATNTAPKPEAAIGEASAEDKALSSGGVQKIPYDTIVYDQNTKKSQNVSGESGIIDYAGRKIVIKNINGVNVPFYLSTGLAGKAAPSGKWYPFFGIGPSDGWINKTTSEDMVNYYGSDELRSAAEELDNTIGDVRNDNSIPKVKAYGQHIDFINNGLNPADNNTPETNDRVTANVEDAINRIRDNAKEPIPEYSDEPIGFVAPEPPVSEAVYEDAAPGKLTATDEEPATQKVMRPSATDEQLTALKIELFGEPKNVRNMTPEELDLYNRERDKRFPPVEVTVYTSAAPVDVSRPRTLSEATDNGPFFAQYTPETAKWYSDVLAGLQSRLSGIIPRMAEINLEQLLGADKNMLIRGQARALKMPGGGIKSIIDLSTGILRPGMTVEQAVEELSKTLNHEIIHVLRDQGVLRPEEWRVLSKSASSTKVPGRAYTYLDKAQAVYTPGGVPISEVYSNPDAVIEEAVAEMYKDWVLNRRAPPNTRGLFNRITELFRRIFRALRSPGHEKVFKSIAAGEIGAREGTSREEGARFSAGPVYDPATSTSDWETMGTPPPGVSSVNQTGGSPFRISQRRPTSVKRIGESLANNLFVDVRSMKLEPGIFEHNIDIVNSYPGFQAKPGETPEMTLKRFKKHVVENLLWLHDKMDPAIRQRAKLWYDGARKITDRLAAQYNLPDTTVAAVLAGLSPQKDWFQNVSLAERLIDITMTKRDVPFDEDMFDYAMSLGSMAQYAPMLEAMRGMTLNDMKSPGFESFFARKHNEILAGVFNPQQINQIVGGDVTLAKAIFVRVYDEVNNPRQYNIITPEGDKGGTSMTGSGAAAKVAWGSNTEIGKGVNAIEDGSKENIDVLLGDKHKIRNFYNNIISPKSTDGSVTIDTHAVAAALLRALAGKSVEVHHNFGTSVKGMTHRTRNSSITGVQGLYAIYADAYREAAKLRGVLPREMQSITWEAVRGLYKPGFKGQKKNVQTIDDIWRLHSDGKISANEARRRVLALADPGAKGINSPFWKDTPSSVIYGVGGPPLNTAGVRAVGLQQTAGGAGSGGAGTDTGSAGRTGPGVKRFSAAPAMESEDFRRWFGDGSLVDGTGAPLKLYTGTSKDIIFQSFKESDRGTWVTSDPNSASQYALENDSMGFRQDGWSYEKTNQASRVIPLYSNVKNILDLSTKEAEDAYKARFGIRDFDGPTGYQKTQAAVGRAAKSEGYDAIQWAPNVWAVFNPKQTLKSQFNEFTPKSIASPKFSAAPLPPSENAQKTQIAGTFPTYKKAIQVLNANSSGTRMLDYGAGLGMSRELGFDTFEPYPRAGFIPTHTESESIPSGSYDKITNLNVLNVVPREMRDAIVGEIGRILAPGGVAVITTRGRDVLNAKGQYGPEPMSIITTANTYQKGFTTKELVDYLRVQLGSGFEVNSLTIGAAGASVKKADVGRFSAAPLPPNITAANQTLFAPLKKNTILQTVSDFFFQPPGGRKILNTIYGPVEIKQRKYAGLQFRANVIDNNAIVEYLEKLKNEKATGQFQLDLGDYSALGALTIESHSSQLAVSALMMGNLKVKLDRPGDMQSAVVSAEENNDNLLNVITAILTPGPVNPTTGKQDNKVDIFRSYAVAMRGRNKKAAGEKVPAQLTDTYINDTISFTQANYPEIVDAYNMYQRVNKRMMEAVRDSGRITDASLANMTRNMDYYGFFREAYEEELSPTIPSKTAADIKFREYTGSEAGNLLGDPIAVMIKNFQFLTSMATKNIAAQKVFNLARDMGEARLLQTGEQPNQAAGEAKDVMFFHDRGVLKRFAVKDPLLVMALGSDPHVDVGGAMKLMGLPTRILRESVTRDPGFMLANLLRDTVATWVATGEDITPFIGTAKGVVTALRDGASFKALMAHGVVGSYDMAMKSAEEVSAMLQRRIMPKGVHLIGSPQGIVNATRMLWDRLGILSEASDAATRIAVYEAAKKQGLSDTEAALRAIRILDFSRHGGSKTLSLLTKLIPFLNARIQGLDVVYQGGAAAVRYMAGKSQSDRDANLGKKFLVRGAMLAAISLALEWLNADDEDYQELPDYVKTGNMLIPLKHFGLPGQFIAVPKAFEAGLLFSTFPQQFYETMKGNASKRDNINLFISSFASTFGVNPIPQGLLPLVEIATNHDFYTGLPLISEGKSRLAPELQYDSRTSTLSMMIAGVPVWYNMDTGKFSGASPIVIEKLISGYTGPFGSLIVSGAGMMMDGFDIGPERLPKSFSQTPVIRRVFVDAESKNPKAVTQAYELFKIVDEANRTFSRLRQTGDAEATIQYYQENKDVLAYKKYVFKMVDRLNKLSAYERQIERDQTMSSAEKLAAMEQLRQVRVQLTANVKEINQRLGR